jgi:hypothetical protein
LFGVVIICWAFRSSTAKPGRIHPAIIAAPIGVFVLLLALVPIAWRRRSSNDKHKDKISRPTNPYLVQSSRAASSSGQLSFGQLSSKRSEMRQEYGIPSMHLALPLSPLSRPAVTALAAERLSRQYQDTEFPDALQPTAPFRRLTQPSHSSVGSRSTSVFSSPLSMVAYPDAQPLSPMEASMGTGLQFTLPPFATRSMSVDDATTSRVTSADELSLGYHSPPRYAVDLGGALGGAGSDAPDAPGPQRAREEGPPAEHAE